MPRKNNQARRLKKKLAKQAAFLSAYSEKMIEEGGKYGEFCERDEMPGKVWVYKADQKETKCDCCDREFCAEDCSTCPRAVANLPCLCASQTCAECMQKHVHTNRKPCDDSDCERIHFECPTCRKSLIFEVPSYGLNTKPAKLFRVE